MTVMTKEISTTQPRFIILEGVDRSGKDSMQDAIDQATKYKHFVLDRGPAGFKAYCELFNKSEELMAAYDEMEKEFSTLPNILMIYIDCSTEVLIDRCIKTDHEILDFDRHKEVYSKFYNQSSIPGVRVDTTNRHVSEIVQDLIKEGVL